MYSQEEIPSPHIEQHLCLLFDGAGLIDISIAQIRKFGRFWQKMASQVETNLLLYKHLKRHLVRCINLKSVHKPGGGKYNES